ncbi:hypothetical protein [Paraburkholderia sp. MM5482-R1]|uniref:hypothetical protein n=1 Tax=unclassified Paraburkholderia TaxID=2615204 RepID=UPI003D1A017E
MTIAPKYITASSSGYSFARACSARRPPARGIVLLQRGQDIVAQHHVAAVVENVELHPSGSEQFAGQADEINPFDRASQFSAVLID